MFCLLKNDTYCQTPNFINFNVDNGLAGSNVYGLMQDSKGFIWFATETGVSKYNGINFKNYALKDGLADNEILNVSEANDGKIWFHSFNGKPSYYYEGKLFNSKNNTSLNNIKIDGFLNDIYTDKNKNIWFSGSKGNLVKLLQNGNTENFPVSGSILKFWENEKKDLIVANTQNGIQTQKDFKSIISLHRFERFSLVNQNLAFASFENQLFKIDLKENKVENIFIENIIEATIISMVYVADEDKLWLGTFNGLYCIENLNSNRNVKNYLPNKAISDILIDREGNYWFSTLGEGVFFCPSFDVLNFNENSGLPNNISFLRKSPNGKIWFGANDGYFGYFENFTQIKIAKIPYTKNKSRVKDLFFINENEVVILSENGLFRSKNNKIEEIESVNLRKIKRLNKDSLLLLTSNAAFVLRVQDFVNALNNRQLNEVLNEQKSSFNVRINDVLSDKYNTWYATEAGLYFSYKKQEFVAFEPHFELFSGRVNKLSSIHENEVWLATNGFGIAGILKDTLVFISDKNGLTNNNCKSIFVSDANTIWVSTNNGINKINILSFKPFQFFVEHFTKMDGLAGDDINDILKIGDTLLVATNSGISVLAEKSFKSKQIAPLINIEKLIINNSIVSDFQEIVIPFKENKIEVEFGGISFKSKGNLQYRYKLKGLDNNWNYTQNNKVIYNLLPPGNYAFVVQVMSKNGLWSQISEELSIEIVYPFYKTWWFFVLISISAASIIVLIIYFISKRIKHNEKRRNEIKNRIAEAEQIALRAQMNPHFIFNSLNSIQRFVLKNDSIAAYQYLEKFSKLIRSILENSQLKKINIEEELQSIKLYLEIESLRFDNKFFYEINVDVSVPSDYKIPTMLLQPFVENAIWHGLLPKEDKSNLRLNISVFRINQFIIFEIIDNGIGREKSKEMTDSFAYKKSSLGTKITEERIQSLNFSNLNQSISFEIIDLYEQEKATGTKVVLKIDTLLELYENE